MIICLFLHKKLCCGCSLELPRRGDSNEHPQHRFYEDLTKIILELSSNIIKYAPYFFCCVAGFLHADGEVSGQTLGKTKFLFCAHSTLMLELVVKNLAKCLFIFVKA